MDKKCISKKIDAVIKKELNLNDDFVLNHENNFVETLGLDSLMLVNLLVAFENDPLLQLNIAGLTYEDLENINTLTDYVLNQSKRS
ncbi:acyl carrier protein [Cytobacillus solani]|uniref:acyl carrier protein n=1 Tax=Cytobacillus solani TaxID=1637975 RepID=UPI001150E05A|nr:acyl carrier protein [Cytobacillus solani]